jgi:nucleoside-diphosphate-sugar epimerase
MRVFVAGASGAIGRPLVRLLLQAGHEVTGMTRVPEVARELRRLGAEGVVCDALMSKALTATVETARPDAVIQQLSATPQEFDMRKYAELLEDTNQLRHEGTRNLIAAAKAVDVQRYVAQSIASAYEQRGAWVKKEEAPLALDSRAPMNAVIGAVADLEVQVLAIGGIVLRYGYFYGPGTQFAKKGYYAKLVRKRRLPIIGSGDGHWSFVHVEDAASATVAALERGSPGVYNIVDDEPAPAREWIPLYARAMDGRPPLEVPKTVGRVLTGPAGMAAMTVQRAANNAKAKRELSWTPLYSSWRDGFRIASG